jgi:hypothetical protein
MTRESTLEESFQDLGLSEAAARLAVAGRADNIVPRPAPRRPSTAAAGRAAELRESIERELAVLDDHVGRIQAGHRRSPRVIESAGAKVSVDLTEAFQELGLSDAGAKLAAGGRG